MARDRATAESNKQRLTCKSTVYTHDAIQLYPAGSIHFPLAVSGKLQLRDTFRNGCYCSHNTNRCMERPYNSSVKVWP